MKVAAGFTLLFCTCVLSACVSRSTISTAEQAPELACVFDGTGTITERKADGTCPSGASEKTVNFGTDVYFREGATTDDILNAGLRVGNAYLQLSDQVATSQDATTMLNIALAAGAAFGVVNGKSTDSLAKVGIVGLGINQASTYFDPVTARNSLTRAARRQLCIVNAGRNFKPDESAATNSVLIEGFTNVRFQLRADLDRDPKYYSDLFESYQQQLERGGPKAAANDPSAEALQARVTGCLGIGSG